MGRYLKFDIPTKNSNISGKHIHKSISSRKKRGEAILATNYIYTITFPILEEKFQFQKFFLVILNFVSDSNFKWENKY